MIHYTILDKQFGPNTEPFGTAHLVEYWTLSTGSSELRKRVDYDKK